MCQTFYKLFGDLILHGAKNVKNNLSSNKSYISSS